MKEPDLINAILIEYGSGPETRLWRNETAQAWVGPAGNARPILAGLCRGSSDIIGIHRGAFVSIEVKTGKTRLTQQQKRFLEVIQELGGIAGVARSVGDVGVILGKGLDSE